MRRYMWVLAGMFLCGACSDRREREVATSGNDGLASDLTLPDTIAHPDSTEPRAKGEPPVSPVEQQVASPESTRPEVKKPVSKRPRRAPRATTRPAPDTSVQAYAPAPPADTSRPDTSSASRAAVDTAPRATSTGAPAAPDTARVPAAPDTAIPVPDSVARPDSLRVAPSTGAAPSPDTTASTTSPDPMVAPQRAPVTDVAARTLAVGTEIRAALDDSITSRRDTAGKPVSAHVMENVVGPDGKTLIAAGTPVRLTITRLRPARSKGSQGRLALRADGVALNGILQPVKAELRPVPRELRGRGVTGSEAAKIGGGAAAGAVLGRVIGGNTRGAVIGGVAGAAAGVAVATQTATRDVVVKAKTPLVLVLTQPLVVP
jgi:hypothetical protein